MTAEQISLPSDFDGVVRLFPLPNLVLFPSNVLPLHIFESRYREMFEDAIQDDQLITMATLKPGYELEHESRPTIPPVVCIGRVIAHEETQQGTYNLMLLGLQRAEIDHEIYPVRSFRQAMVKVLAERSSDTDETGGEVAQKLAERVLQALPPAQKLVQGVSQGQISLALLTDVVAFHMPFPIELKLQLLAERDPLSRAELLLENLPERKPGGQGAKRYPPDFSVN